MSILTTTNTGKYKQILSWASQFDGRPDIHYRVENKKDGQYKLIISPEGWGHMVIIDAKEMPCSIYFENHPTVIFLKFGDNCVKYLSPRLKAFCEDVRFNQCIFTDKSEKFIKANRNCISNSLIVCRNKEVADMFINAEPYSELFVNNSVTVVYSPIEEEEEEEEELFGLTNIDMIVNNQKDEKEKQIYVKLRDKLLECMKNSE